ncbi:MAG: hypothetical protein ABIZ49_02505 [Opitutaceae bacterium]
MSTSTSHPPRLVCRLVRRWAAVGGNPEARSLGSHHIAHCPDCARFFAAVQTLDFSLKRDAARYSAPIPTGLEERITRAVQRSTVAGVPSVNSQRSGARRTSFAFGTIALAGVAAAVLAVVFLPKPVTPSSEVAPRGVLVNTTPSAGVEPLGNRFWNSLPSSASEVLNRNPLEEEAAAVYADAQSAVRFLAMNFLPAAATASGRRLSDG